MSLQATDSLRSECNEYTMTVLTDRVSRTSGEPMNEEKFNITLRQFLKVFGIAGQREIEKAVDAALKDGTIKGTETLRAKATLEIEGLPLRKVVEGDIELE